MRNPRTHASRRTSRPTRKAGGHTDSGDSPNADISARPSNETILRLRYEAFIDFQVWPVGKIFPTEWLSNFRSDERDLASALLHGFMFFSEPLVDGLVWGALRNLARAYASDRASDKVASWREFLNSVLVCNVEGEEPNPTDSSHIIARKFRQLFKLEEDKFVSPATGLQRLQDVAGTKILFVDDFVGSGLQFTTTIHRIRPDAGGSAFATLPAPLRSNIFYAPLVCTEEGLDAIGDGAPDVICVPANMLPKRYNVLHPESHIWPDSLRADAVARLRAASLRAGISDDAWMGFDRLGLTLAFYHSTPDGTLPIFHHDVPGWHPLVRKS